MFIQDNTQEKNRIMSAVRKPRRRWVNSLIVIVSLAAALIVGEWGVRTVSPQVGTNDDILGYRMQPGGDWDTNGYRNDSVLSQANLVVLGDSQTYGNNAESHESWPYVLGQLASTSVYQMAVGGFCPVQYGYLIDQALALHPRIVVVGFYLGNDLLESYGLAYGNSYWAKLQNPNFITPATTSDPVAVRHAIQTGLPTGSLEARIYEVRLWMRIHSRLYELLGDATRNVRERVGVARTIEERRSLVERFLESHPEAGYIYKDRPEIKTVLSPSYRLEGVNLDEPRTQEGWRIVREQFLEIKKKTDAAHVPLVIAVIPTKELVYGTSITENNGDISEEFQRYVNAEERLHNTTLRFCEQEHFFCISTLDAMVSALNNREVIYGQTMDGHPLAGGYHVIAEAIYKYLTKQQYQ